MPSSTATTSGSLSTSAAGSPCSESSEVAETQPCKGEPSGRPCKCLALIHPSESVPLKAKRLWNIPGNCPTPPPPRASSHCHRSREHRHGAGPVPGMARVILTHFSAVRKKSGPRPAVATPVHHPSLHHGQQLRRRD